MVIRPVFQATFFMVLMLLMGIIYASTVAWVFRELNCIWSILICFHLLPFHVRNAPQAGMLSQ
jgi:hypothetical protein